MCIYDWVHSLFIVSFFCLLKIGSTPSIFPHFFSLSLSLSRARETKSARKNLLWEHTECINKTRKVFKTHIDWFQWKIADLSALCETMLTITNVWKTYLTITFCNQSWAKLSLTQKRKWLIKIIASSQISTKAKVVTPGSVQSSSCNSFCVRS